MNMKLKSIVITIAVSGLLPTANVLTAKLVNPLEQAISNKVIPDYLRPIDNDPSRLKGHRHLEKDKKAVEENPVQTEQNARMKDSDKAKEKSLKEQDGKMQADDENRKREVAQDAEMAESNAKQDAEMAKLNEKQGQERQEAQDRETAAHDAITNAPDPSKVAANEVDGSTW